MVVGFAKYLGGRLVAGAKSIGDAVVQSGVKSVSAIIDSGKAVKDFATKVVTDAADKFRGHFSDDVPGGDDASTLPAVEPLQIELRLALEPADRKFIDLLRMMSHRATVDDGDPLPPLPPEASWASSEKTLLQLSLTYDEWPGARRDDGKQLMRWRPASDRSLRVQVGSYSRAADTQKLMQHVHARAAWGLELLREPQQQVVALPRNDGVVRRAKVEDTGAYVLPTLGAQHLELRLHAARRRRVLPLHLRRVDHLRLVPGGARLSPLLGLRRLPLRLRLGGRSPRRAAT